MLYTDRIKSPTSFTNSAGLFHGTNRQSTRQSRSHMRERWEERDSPLSMHPVPGIEFDEFLGERKGGVSLGRKGGRGGTKNAPSPGRTPQPPADCGD